MFKSVKKHMKIINLIQYFKDRVSTGGYPLLITEEYNYVMANYDKEDIINSFIEVFASNRNKESVFKNIDIKAVETKFNKLSEKTGKLLDSENINILMKHNYQFDIGECLGVIQLSHYYNDISNYFHIENRMKCGGYNRVPPYQIWNGEGLEEIKWRKLLRGFISPLFRSVNDKRRITVHEYRFCFRLSSTVYTPMQFKPETAKTVIELLSKNGRVLDFSSGWGDRLAGFHASKNGTYYLGTDPNHALHEGYVKQMKHYKSFGSTKESNIAKLSAEDLKWGLFKDFDLVFTSPPYFTTELYGKGESSEHLQSWYRYTEYQNWRDNFLFKTIDNILPCLTKQAIFAINIFDITIKGTEYNVCEELHNHMISRGFVYRGYLGMRMKQKPKNINDDNNKKYMASYYVEPIWIYESQ